MAKEARRSGSKGLVIGHLERISSDVFDKYSKVITGVVGASMAYMLCTEITNCTMLASLLT